MKNFQYQLPTMTQNVTTYKKVVRFLLLVVRSQISMQVRDNTQKHPKPSLQKPLLRQISKVLTPREVSEFSRPLLKEPLKASSKVLTDTVLARMREQSKCLGISKLIKISPKKTATCLVAI